MNHSLDNDEYANNFVSTVLYFFKLQRPIVTLAHNTFLYHTYALGKLNKISILSDSIL